VLQTFKGHSDKVTNVALSPDGTKIVSGSQDNSIKLWDMQSVGFFMLKYYLLSRENGAIDAVKPNKCRHRSPRYTVVNSISIKKLTAYSKWLSAGNECYFCVSHLSDIMYRYASRDVKRNAPLFIHEVDVKNDKNLLDDEVGHHDGASNFSIYEGKYANSVLITKTYDLTQKEDLDQLIAIGLFEDDEGSLFRGDNLRSYFEWLVACNHQALFTYLYDKEPYFSIIQYIVMENRPELLRYIIERSVSNEKNEYVLEDYTRSIENALEYVAENGMGDMLEILLPYASNRLGSLLIGLLSAVDVSNQELIDKFLEQLTQVAGYNELLEAVHYVTPREKLHLFKRFYFHIFIAPSSGEWDELVLLALACDSDELFSQLFSNDSASLINIGMNKVVRLTKHIEEQIQDTNIGLKDMVKEGNIIACQIILDNTPRVSLSSEQRFKIKPTDDLDDCLLIAAKKGYFGIVKLLIKHGADAKTWMNFPIKYANKYNYSAMKKYFLELGVAEEKFT